MKSPAPHITQKNNKKGKSFWFCEKCGGENYCECLGGMADPICDCGWPGYACHCEEEEEYWWE